ncbi:TetR/AcrR family transcriptional regulator [Enterococcus dongliensis]|uniref:TetR/AcrR family transcriptional regulator n=1 Tax=Enterococcus dongliensis TaxID=2559925 RepID=A0AAP5TZT0_9ENTE|nr:TetR/AcrR family transcriptional regulator [Enterococcus dongliensis]MDT2595451.1 TetR/AcrR family transcriptional regulator [Enterococcus dongliensis]MDT2603335.1 TetR/AcrR family transcriptional regulator [Enterococcus dongliensis]MDT2612692.1 TetR/AcrR family transcriptional regulator [Enterococcus dongliensis]MDT2633696.1 TetR/AcrR family transcriptional regulator [Enterococcus dongliensis]MDT2635930.1 TetR/AcrR family transcriptional regulator [Enterococcus dongliensis]
MPKKTFLNLPKTRQAEIRELLLTIFYEKPVSQVKVSEIVEALQMSRGIFYKYFEDLNDAYDYLIHFYAGEIHSEIITYMTKQESDFFQGIEAFLLLYVDLDHSSSRYRQLVLLAQNSHLFSYRSAAEHGITEWKQLLAENQFVMSTVEEQISFLYFSMKLVIDSLTDMLANHWGTEELLKDFRFKTRWLLEGIKKR